MDSSGIPRVIGQTPGVPCGMVDSTTEILYPFHLVRDFIIVVKISPIEKLSMKNKESIMIYQAEQTPKSSISLSSIDLRGSSLSTNMHTQLLFIYENHVNKTESSRNIFDNTKMLKSTLSRVLVPFYPAAGRLRKRDDDGLLEVDCNAEGALFVEAETKHTLSDFGKYLTPNDLLRKLVCPTYDSSKGLSSVPLSMVQLTRFRCGGVCLDFALDHQLADGVSFFHLIKSWERLTRQLDLVDLPIFDRSYLAARDPPVIEFDHLYNESPLPPPKDSSGETIATTECIFELTHLQIDALKEEAASPALRYKSSTYEVLAAHVWRCVITKARGLAYNQDLVH